MTEEPRLLHCCINAANDLYAARYPLEPGLHDDWLRNHLLSVAQKWGRVTRAFSESVFIRSVPRQHFFDARTFSLSCPNDHRVDVVLLGSRVYYLAWRVNLICATYFTQIESETDRTHLAGATDGSWPEQAHVEQLQTALRVYLNDEFLSNEGFAELKSLLAAVNTPTSINQEYIGDFALLFLMLHEIQHSMRMDQMAAGSLAHRVEANVDGLSQKRKERWSAELSHDANAALVLLVSATEVLHAVHGLSSGHAKAQAASLVFPGADLALHILQFVEQRRFGEVAPERAAYMREFARHPPSEIRRRSLSHLAFASITNMPVAAMLQGYTTEDWKFVAQNTASQMIVRDRLFQAYHRTEQVKEKHHVKT